MKEHLEEEADAKMEVERQLSKAFADIQLWKTRYETEGIARCEEIEKDKAKVAGRLAEAEDTISSLQEKIASLEKSKARAKAEFDDLSSECERHNTNAAIIEKRGRNFDKVVNEWRLKAEDLQNEITGSQTECRNFSSEYFRVKSANEELMEHLDTVKRENKNLAEEIKVQQSCFIIQIHEVYFSGSSRPTGRGWSIHARAGQISQEAGSREGGAPKWT